MAPAARRPPGELALRTLTGSNTALHQANAGVRTLVAPDPGGTVQQGIQKRRRSTMYRIPGVLSGTTTTPAPAVPRVQPTRDPPPGSQQAPGDGRATDPPEAIPGQAEDRERIAAGLNDVVVRRLLTAGQDLQAALGLLSNHPANGKIRHVADELDQAIRDIQGTIFDHPAGKRPPLDTSTIRT